MPRDILLGVNHGAAIIRAIERCRAMVLEFVAQALYLSSSEKS